MERYAQILLKNGFEYVEGTNGYKKGKEHVYLVGVNGNVGGYVLFTSKEIAEVAGFTPPCYFINSLCGGAKIVSNMHYYGYATVFYETKEGDIRILMQKDETIYFIDMQPSTYEFFMKNTIYNPDIAKCLRQFRVHLGFTNTFILHYKISSAIVTDEYI